MIKLKDCWVGKEVAVKYWTFPGGEVGVKIESEIHQESVYEISVTGTVNPTDIFYLLNICDALKQAGVPKENVELLMPYLPYARQDRVCHSGESFALEVFIKLLSTAWFSRLFVSDLHSNVSAELLYKHGIQFWPESQIFQMAGLYDAVIAPDKGAEQKAKRIANAAGVKLICLNKTRTAGEVTYNVPEGTVLQGRCIVVDDICDGGATFNALAQAVKTTGLELDLYVTHGIFSKGVDELLKNYATIYTRNLMNEDVAYKVVVIKD